MNDKATDKQARALEVLIDALNKRFEVAEARILNLEEALFADAAEVAEEEYMQQREEWLEKGRELEAQRRRPS